MRGLAAGDWVDLSNYREPNGDGGRRLEVQAGAALGSGRTLLEDRDLACVLERLRAREVGIVIFIGGNGTMSAARKLSRAAAEARTTPPLRVIGVPKTIDNDVCGTDVCPGYGSAARFVARSVHDAGLDIAAMQDFDDVAIFEVMGRTSGWIAAAASLARGANCVAPRLILLPELAFDEEEFLVQVERWHERDGTCMVVAAEGIRDRQGNFLAERDQVVDRDASGQALVGIAGGPAPYLARLVRERLGLRCRQIRPDMIQRSSSALASEVDRLLAREVGSDAVRAAVEGWSDVMIGLERRDRRWSTVRVPIDQVAGRERTLPEDFIARNRFDVTPSFVSYALPLLGDWTPGAVLFR